MSWWRRHDAAIESYIPALRRFAFGLVRSLPDADDLVQETLMQALSTAHPLRDPARLKPWLFAILYRCFLNQRRASGRRPAMETYDEATHALGTAPEQDTPLQQRDLLRALAQLPEEQNVLLLLIGVEDMTYKEAADLLDIPIGTVMSRLARGRATLRALLEGRVIPLQRHG
jgi:RNA polymerase sigma-70 factor (ECF subfamily)